MNIWHSRTVALAAAATTMLAGCTAAHRDAGLAALSRPGDRNVTVAAIPSADLAGSYSDAALMWWADRIREWSANGQDVLVYFNNDRDANAVRNARTLQAMLVPGSIGHPDNQHVRRGTEPGSGPLDAWVLQAPEGASQCGGAWSARMAAG